MPLFLVLTEFKHRWLVQKNLGVTGDRSCTKSEWSAAVQLLNHTRENVNSNWEASAWKIMGKRHDKLKGLFVWSNLFLCCSDIPQLIKICLQTVEFFIPIAFLWRLSWTSLWCCFESFCKSAASIYLWPVCDHFKIFPFINSNLLLATFSEGFRA